MGPLGPLLRWGATVAAVDLAVPAIWERVLTTARSGAGRLLVPTSTGSADSLVGQGRRRPARRGAGRRRLAGRTRRAAAGGQLPVRRRGHARARVGGGRRPRGPGRRGASGHRAGVPGHADRRLRRPSRCRRALRARVRRAHGGRQDARSPVALGHARAAAPARLPGRRRPRHRRQPRAQQGPNYALAKRIQRWRATTARHEGRQVSFHVAPSTRTRSVVKNRALAAAFAGAHRFGVEVFDPDTANTLMAALLVHDLSAEPAAARAPLAGRGVRRGPRRVVAGGVRAAQRARPRRRARLRERAGLTPLVHCLAVSSATRSMLSWAAANAPPAAAAPTWAERSVTLPASHTPGTVLRPIGSAGRWTPIPEGCSTGSRPSPARKSALATIRVPTTRVSRATTRAVGGPDADESAVLGDHLGDRALDHDDVAGGELLGLLLGQRRGLVQEQHDVVGPLSPQQRAVDGEGVGADHADGPVAHLPPVAVGAVQHVVTPALAQSGYVGELVDQPAGDQQPARPDRAPVGQPDAEAVALARRPRRPAVGDVAAVSRTSARPRSSSSAGGVPSRAKSPCTASAGALRGAPASTTSTLRRARPSIRPALRPAAPPPMTTTSYSVVISSMTRGCAAHAESANVFADVANCCHG